MKVGAATAPVSDAVEGVICQHILGFRVDDGEALLADGYSHNIWEVWF